MAHDLAIVRHELAGRLAAIDLRVPPARGLELVAAVEEVRLLAQGAGMHAAATVARVVTVALARGERGAGVLGALHLLGDAIGTERQDGGASDAFAALCSVRLAA